MWRVGFTRLSWTCVQAAIAHRDGGHLGFAQSFSTSSFRNVPRYEVSSSGRCEGSWSSRAFFRDGTLHSDTLTLFFFHPIKRSQSTAVSTLSFSATLCIPRHTTESARIRRRCYCKCTSHRVANNNQQTNRPHSRATVCTPATSANT